MAKARRTTDHATIQRWVEERGGRPAHVSRTGSVGDPGILRIDFPAKGGSPSLAPIDWDHWFDAFEANRLAFLFQDETAEGGTSRFNRFVNRRPDDDLADAPPHRRGTRRKGRTADVDLNTASEEELEALYGIGPVYAGAIARLRAERGHIEPDDLREIRGIDTATIDRLRAQVR